LSPISHPAWGPDCSPWVLRSRQGRVSLAGCQLQSARERSALSRGRPGRGEWGAAGGDGLAPPDRPAALPGHRAPALLRAPWGLGLLPWGQGGLARGEMLAGGGAQGWGAQGWGRHGGAPRLGVHTTHKWARGTGLPCEPQGSKATAAGEPWGAAPTQPHPTPRGAAPPGTPPGAGCPSPALSNPQRPPFATGPRGDVTGCSRRLSSQRANPRPCHQPPPAGWSSRGLRAGLQPPHVGSVLTAVVCAGEQWGARLCPPGCGWWLWASRRRGGAAVPIRGVCTVMGGVRGAERRADSSRCALLTSPCPPRHPLARVGLSVSAQGWPSSPRNGTAAAGAVSCRDTPRPVPAPHPRAPSPQRAPEGRRCQALPSVHTQPAARNVVILLFINNSR